MRKLSCGLWVLITTSSLLVAHALPLAADELGATPTYWQVDLLYPDVARDKLTGLYAELHKRHQLEVRTVTLGVGESPADAMIRAGAWHRWLGDSDVTLERLLCNLNSDACSPKLKLRALQSGQNIKIPTLPINMGRRYTIIRSEVLPIKRILKTSRLDDVTCHARITRASSCIIDDGKNFPYTLVFSGGEVPNDATIAGLPVDVEFVRNAGRPNSPILLAAIPILSLSFNIINESSDQASNMSDASNEIGESYDENYKPNYLGSKENNEELARHLSPNATFGNPFELKSNNTGTNIDSLNIDDWEDSINISSVLNSMPNSTTADVSILVIDERATLDHCSFSPDIKFFFMNEAGEWEKAPSPSEACDNNIRIGDPYLDHGTHVLGLFLADRNVNGRRVRGALANTKKITVLFFSIGLNFDEGGNEIIGENVIKTLDAVKGTTSVKVVSMSVSFLQNNGGRLLTKTLKDAKDWLLVVTSSGNDNKGPNDTCDRIPACLPEPHVLSVVAMANRPSDGWTLLSGSNHGRKYHDIGAPGRDILSSTERNDFGTLSGTSQATPMVAAVAARIFQQFNMRPEEVANRLIWSARMFDDMLGDAKGTMLDARVALDVDRDWVWLTDGCVLRGLLEDVEGGDFSFDPTRAGQRSYFNEDEMRRLHVNTSRAHYLVMWEAANGRLESEEFSFFLDRSGERRVTFFVESNERNDGRCNRPAGSVTTFRMTDIQDLVFSHPSRRGTH